MKRPLLIDREFAERIDADHAARLVGEKHAPALMRTLHEMLTRRYDVVAVTVVNDRLAVSTPGCGWVVVS